MIYKLGRGSERLSGGYLDLIMICKVCKVASAAGSAKSHHVPPKGQWWGWCRRFLVYWCSARGVDGFELSSLVIEAAHALLGTFISGFLY
jgi:hypothetical protein